MAKLLLPNATANQTLLGPEMVMLASPPATLAFNLTSEDKDDYDAHDGVPAFLQ